MYCMLLSERLKKSVSRSIRRRIGANPIDGSGEDPRPPFDASDARVRDRVVFELEPERGKTPGRLRVSARKGAPCSSALTKTTRGLRSCGKALTLSSVTLNAAAFAAAASVSTTFAQPDGST